jgi:uncharacterized protein (UPF0371 family)
LEAYGITTVNYNRDVEVFPVLNAIFEKIAGVSPYKSPTDMGVNMLASCIIDDEACKEASLQEIVRRYYQALIDRRIGNGKDAAVYKIELLMKKAGIDTSIRKCVNASLELAEATEQPAAAIELTDGRIVTGKTSALLGASSAAMLNALKALGGIDDELHLISPTIIEPIQDLKINHLGNRNPRLHMDEVLIALSICAVTDPTAEQAMRQIEKLKGCNAHSTVILSQVDNSTYKKLGIHLTCEPKYQTKKLFHK